MEDSITWVGVDAHKKEHRVAVRVVGSDDIEEWTIGNESREIERIFKRLVKRNSGEVRVCYEAGVCGFALQRKIESCGAKCSVIAPSLVPVRPGVRVKTDRRDARKLLELFQAGLLTEIEPPNEQDESLRDLCRCREAVQKDLGRMRHRLLKFLSRRGIYYKHGRNWTKGHMSWLAGVKFENYLDQRVFKEYLSQILEQGDRLKELDALLKEVSEEEPYAMPVGWLRCFHGIDTVTAISLVAELYSIERFNSAPELMAYLGLTPSQDSSGEHERYGPITKTGNRRVRRLLVEAAWQYHRSSVAGKTLNARRAGQPDWAIRIAKKAHRRLNHRYWRLIRKGKTPNKVVVSVARELAGFIWAVLHTQAEVVEWDVAAD